MKPVWLAGLAFAWLLCANTAAADTTGGNDWMDTSTPDDGIGSLPGDGLDGWFFSSDPDLPFPSEADPSQPWTSAANIATLNYWLNLVTELGDDPSLLAELYGSGMISPPSLASAPVSQSIQAISEDAVGNVPEPTTSELLGAGLAFLGLYAAERPRRMRGQ